MRVRRLVSVAHEHGTAAVVRDRRGRVWLGDPNPSLLLEGFRAGVHGVGPEVTAAGGLLPPSATGAQVFDRAGAGHPASCAEGAWIALLPEPVRGELPLVRFLGPAGALVAVPLPADIETEPVGDAREPCPVCGVADWARVVSAPEGRFGEDGSGRPTAALCRRCGHEEGLGVLMFAELDEPAEPAAWAESEAQMAGELSAKA